MLELDELPDAGSLLRFGESLLLELELAPGFTLTLPLALPLTLPPSRVTLELLLDPSRAAAIRARSSTVTLELAVPGSRSTVVELELEVPGAGTTVVLLELEPGAGTLRSSTTVRSQPAIERAIAVAPAIRTNL